MDPDLISGPDGKQREVMDYFLSPKNTLGQPYWNKVKKYILNPLGPIYFRFLRLIYSGCHLNQSGMIMECFNLLLNPHVHVLPRTCSLFNSIVGHVLCVRTSGNRK